jgi:hypothetical protein
MKRAGSFPKYIIISKMLTHLRLASVVLDAVAVDAVLLLGQPETLEEGGSVLKERTTRLTT